MTADRKIHIADDRFVDRLDEIVDELRQAAPATVTFALIGRRHLRTNNSWMHNVEKLVAGRRLCTAMISEDDAARLGIADGEIVNVTSPLGSISIPVEVSDAIMGSSQQRYVKSHGI